MIYLDQKLTVTTNVERKAIRVKFSDQPDPVDTVTLSLTIEEARALARDLSHAAFHLEMMLGALNTPS